MKVIHVSETWQRAAVYYLRINAFVKGQRIPLDLEFDDGDGEKAKYILLLDNEKPIATARLNIVDTKTAKIERVCVAENYRGQGVGRKLIEATEEWSKEYNVKKIIITSQFKAKGFYESLNYKVNPNIKSESTIPIVYTEKIL